MQTIARHRPLGLPTTRPRLHANRRPQPWGQALLAGLVAGAVATVPMTLFMGVAHRQLPRRQRYSLPPEQITTRLSRAADVPARPEGEGWEAKTYAAHFGFGASAGAGYGLIANQVPGQPAVKGMAYGLAVWATSYLGWLPAVGLTPSATREPQERNLLMITAHLVWGATTGVVQDKLRRRLAPASLPGHGANRNSG